jgi:HAD superfamily hydrolase (TIGR01509 family)
MFEAVIFDMDGVIIDSEPFHLEVNIELYRKLNIDMSSEEYFDRFIGTSNQQMWSYLKDRYALPQTLQQLLDLATRSLVDHLQQLRIDPIPGVVDLMQQLLDRGTRLALASSSPREVIDAVVGKFGMAPFFTAVVSGDDVVRAKPDPEIFLKAAGTLKVQPASCVVIEDSMRGVSAAKAAGMRCIAFVNLNSGEQDLSGADLKVDSFTGLTVETIGKLFIG